MNSGFLYNEFYKELENALPSSTMEIRRMWVTKIIERNIDIKDLSGLLKSEKKVAIRFLWLLTEIGLTDPKKLYAELTFLLNLSEGLDHKYKESFVSFWLNVGVPPENEGYAIDLLFQFLVSSDTNVTVRSRAMLVLYKITKKYPELKNELRHSLADQIDRYSKDFQKRATRIINAIDQ